MKIREFRGKSLINKEKEMIFLLNWFNKIPDEILWVFGPKSCGKTTLIEYIVENELFEDFWNFKPKGNFFVKYMNLRGYLISSYDRFIEALLTPKKTNFKKALLLCENIDPKDTPYLPLSIELNIPLWTNDKKLIKGLIDKGYKNIITTEEIFKLTIKEWYLSVNY